MQEISVLGLVASSFAATKSQPIPELKLFEKLFLSRYTPWRGVLLSASFHCLVIFVLVPLSYLLPDSEEEAWRRHARLLHALEVQIPDRLYFTPQQPEPPKPPAERPPEQKPAAEPKQVAKAGAAALAPKLEAPRILPRKFRLPDLPQKLDADQTLIQPHLPPDLALKAQVKLPQLFLQSPDVPRPASRKFVEPGRSGPPNVVAKLDAPPELAMPGQVPADVQIASMLTGPEEALLHLPRPTLQARAFRPPTSGGSGRGASVNPTLGEPVSVLSWSADPAPLKDRITFPLGNQIGRMPVSPPDAPVGIPSAASGSPTGVAGAIGEGSGEGNGAGVGAGAGDGDGEGSSKTGADGGSGTTGDGSGTGDTQGGAGVEIAAARSSAAINYAPPIRVEHPSNAVFDVVVVQSSADGSLPESAGVLTGQPVYTVYLQVGAPRAWLLQYCIPKDIVPGPKVVGSTVYIGRPTPVKAPFPLVTVLPPVTLQPRARYIMVHGFVDKSGQFKDLTLLRAPSDQSSELLLPQLARWHFRPATRDGVPILVEILLAIPPHEG
jgi:hypothetical protein